MTLIEELEKEKEERLSETSIKQLLDKFSKWGSSAKEIAVQSLYVKDEYKEQYEKVFDEIDAYVSKVAREICHRLTK